MATTKIRKPVSYIDFLKLKQYIKETTKDKKSNEGNIIVDDKSVEFPDEMGNRINYLV
jgi:hypothetical protein